jgi:hypothetical protein
LWSVDLCFMSYELFSVHRHVQMLYKNIVVELYFPLYFALVFKLGFYCSTPCSLEFTSFYWLHLVLLSSLWSWFASTSINESMTSSCDFKLDSILTWIHLGESYILMLPKWFLLYLWCRLRSARRSRRAR